MVDGDRQIAQRTTQLLGQALELPRPLRPVAHHRKGTGLVRKWHGAARYPHPITANSRCFELDVPSHR